MLRLTKPSARQKTGFLDTSRTTGRVLENLDGDVTTSETVGLVANLLYYTGRLSGWIVDNARLYCTVDGRKRLGTL
jgi:hypothetical protein